MRVSISHGMERNVPELETNLQIVPKQCVPLTPEARGNSHPHGDTSTLTT